ncbi:MAG: dTDP-4-dehydrorhamnose 3,5-epimerase [Actinomycetota bacterium]|nr:dTDP-4-dehydrorhamnose 3,5-epimerase [Actinomycetota bacterium]
MIFHETPLAGAYVIDIEPAPDARGFFARIFAEDEFAREGIEFRPLQCSISYNARAGTLRGLHYQAPPHSEAKLVRCTRGRIFDVIVDLREASPTFGRWVSAELTDANHRALYAPEGFAHGFESLEDGSEVLYMISSGYNPAAARGIRWDDPTLAINWPAPPVLVSKRDADLPGFGR